MRKNGILAALAAIAVCCTAAGASTAIANAATFDEQTVTNVLANTPDERVFLTDFSGNELFIAGGAHNGANPATKAMLTDGKVDSFWTAKLVDSAGNDALGYFTLDAGAEYVVSSLLVDFVHDWGATDASVELSATADFADPIVIYSNIEGERFSADSTYSPNGAIMNTAWKGVTFEFSPVVARYVRITGNLLGNGTNLGYTSIGEVQMFGVTEGLAVGANAVSGATVDAGSVALKANVSDAEIYYTLDGSAPTKNSIRYETPIVVDGTAKIRAVAYKDGIYCRPADFVFYGEAPFVSENAALNKTVTAYDKDGNDISGYVTDHNGGVSLECVVDGTKGLFNSIYFQNEGTAVLGFVQVDMGESYWINRVDLTLWNDWVFRAIVVQISDDPTFQTGVHTVICTDFGNWLGAGLNEVVGTLDPNYTLHTQTEWNGHSGDGWVFNFEPVKGRYIRTANQAGSAPYTMVLTELQAWTCEAPEEPGENDGYEYQEYLAYIDGVAPIEVYVNKDFSELGLPEAINGVLSDGEAVSIPAAWICDGYDKTVAGEYVATLHATHEKDVYGLLDISVTIKVLALDKGALEAALTAANAVDTTNMTTSSADAFIEAKTVAESLSGYLTQAQVNAATTALENAMNGLVERGDVTALRTLVQEVEGLTAVSFTQASWAVVETALAPAKAAVAENGNANLTQADVDGLTAALQNAKDALALKGNADALSAYYAQVKAECGYSEEDTCGYTKATFFAYMDKMYAAEAMIAKVAAGEVAQSEIDATLSELQAAVAALTECADLTALQTAVATAKALAAEEYTASSYAALLEVLTNAESVANKPANEQVQADADAVLADLNAAVAALVAAGDQTALKAALNEKGNAVEGDYTAATYAVYAQAVWTAKQLNGNADADETSVNNAIEALNAAYAALIKLGDRNALQAAIDQAKAVSTDNAAAKANLENAIAYATEMLEFEGEITEAQVTEAIALLAAAENSVPAPVESSGCASSFSGYMAMAMAFMVMAVAVICRKEERNE